MKSYEKWRKNLVPPNALRDLRQMIRTLLSSLFASPFLSDPTNPGDVPVPAPLKPLPTDAAPAASLTFTCSQGLVWF